MKLLYLRRLYIAKTLLRRHVYALLVARSTVCVPSGYVRESLFARRENSLHDSAAVSSYVYTDAIDCPLAVYLTNGVASQRRWERVSAVVSTSGNSGR